MTDPLDAVRQAARDTWLDPVDVARDVARHLLDLSASEEWDAVGLEAVSELRRHRADSALILAATEAALDAAGTDPVAALEKFLTELDDRTWTRDLARRAAHHPTLGVTSMGASTLAVLEAGLRLGAEWDRLLCGRRAVAQGLGYLQIRIDVAPPEHAEGMLAAGAAVYRGRMWTTARDADTVTRARLGHTGVIPVVHPLAHLSPLNRKAYRPAPELIDVDVDG
jgi:hypothetical protein